MTATRITATPNPAKVGDTVTVCYNFAGSGITGPVTLSVTYDGTDGGESLQVELLSPCSSFVVPEGCISALIEDMTGSSGDLLVTVLQ